MEGREEKVVHIVVVVLVCFSLFEFSGLRSQEKLLEFFSFEFRCRERIAFVELSPFAEGAQLSSGALKNGGGAK